MCVGWCPLTVPLSVLVLFVSTILTLNIRSFSVQSHESLLAIICTTLLLLSSLMGIYGNLSLIFAVLTTIFI